MIKIIIAEHRRHPWVIPGVLLTGSAALGTALPDILAALARIVS